MRVSQETIASGAIVVGCLAAVLAVWNANARPATVRKINFVYPVIQIFCI
jgi:hypothetical protein